jgi:hypothetical protein
MHLRVCCKFLIRCVTQVIWPGGGWEQGGKINLRPCFQGHKVTLPTCPPPPEGGTPLICGPVCRSVPLPDVELCGLHNERTTPAGLASVERRDDNMSILRTIWDQSLLMRKHKHNQVVILAMGCLGFEPGS